MGVESVNSWITVRRYDQLDSSLEEVSGSPPLLIELQKDSSLAELKVQLRTWLGIPEQSEVVMKLRRSDGTFVTLSTLLSGSTEAEPFILDIARIHQSIPASARSPLSPSYVETVRSKLKCLEKRVEQVESLIPELRTRRQSSVDQMVQQLGTKVQFLDRRLDELMPAEWKSQMK